MNRACAFSITVAAVVLSGCAFDPRLSTDTVYLGGRRVPTPDRTGQRDRMNYDNVSYWDGDHNSGSPRIHISLGEQKAYFYKADQLVGVSIVSTGREGFDTPAGSFRVLQKNKDHVSSIFGDYVDAVTGTTIQKDIDTRKDPKPRGAKYDGAKMPFFIRINGGVGMHAGFLPGYPASHGCIRMPPFMAAAFFRNVTLGTPVKVTH